MTQSLLMEKYPIFSLEIPKNECRFESLIDITSFLRSCIDNDPIATFISEFDHYRHTSDHGGEIAPDILQAQLLIFCFGHKLPLPQLLAARPRSIGLCERENDFVITFLEAPMPSINEKMEAWAKSLMK